MAISSYGVTLKYKASSSASTYTKLCDVKDFPDMIGDPNLLETTTLSDSQQTYIKGIKQNQLLQFTINWDETVCQTIVGLESAEQDFELDFSDGTTFTWKGEVALGVPGKGVDEVNEAIINIIPTTAITLAFS